MKTKLPNTIKPACSDLSEGENQTDKATARYCAAISAAHAGLTLEHSTSIREMGVELDKLRAEHAALVAVAEAATHYLITLDDKDAQRLTEALADVVILREGGAA